MPSRLPETTHAAGMFRPPRRQYQCRLASVQPRLDRFKRRGFVARFDPFGGFQPRAGSFNEGLLMRGIVRRRPAKALQRELAAYANMLHRTGPTWCSLVAIADGKVQRFARPKASPDWGTLRGQESRHQAKENPAAAGFSLDCPVAWRAKDGIHLRSTGASVQSQGLVPAWCRTASRSDCDVREYTEGAMLIPACGMPQCAIHPRMEPGGIGAVHPGEIWRRRCWSSALYRSRMSRSWARPTTSRRTARRKPARRPSDHAFHVTWRSPATAASRSCGCRTATRLLRPWSSGS